MGLQPTKRDEAPEGAPPLSRFVRQGGDFDFLPTAPTAEFRQSGRPSRL